MRLDQFLVQSDICSRSEAKKIIKAGRVCVNGSIIKDNSAHIDADTSEVKLDGRVIDYSKFHYYMLNKPAGCVSATKDGLSSTVIDLLKGENVKKCFPIGRLDKDTEGLLLICDDGPLAHELLSPKHHVDKTYLVYSDKALSEEDTNRLEQGIDIGDDKLTMPARVVYLGACSLDGEMSHLYELTIYEGRFHQIKRMFAACGCNVIYLKRVSMGPIKLDEALDKGQYRRLTENEVNLLKEYRK